MVIKEVTNRHIVNQAEFVAAAAACACQAIWLKKIFEELQFKEDEPTLVHSKLSINYWSG